jgi:hypothetical protein
MGRLCLFVHEVISTLKVLNSKEQSPLSQVRAHTALLPMEPKGYVLFSEKSTTGHYIAHLAKTASNLHI